MFCFQHAVPVVQCSRLQAPSLLRGDVSELFCCSPGTCLGILDVGLMDTQRGETEKVEQSPFHGWWHPQVQATLGGRLCLDSPGKRRWGSCLAETQVQVPVSVRLSGSAIWCESLFRDRGATWGEREQIAILLLGWVFFIPFTTTLQVHGFIWLFVFPAY